MKILISVVLIILIAILMPAHAGQLAPDPNAGTIIVGGSSENDHTPFTNNGTVQIDTGGTLDNTGSLHNFGTVNNSGALTNSGSLTNDSGGTLNIHSGGTLNNHSVLNNESGATLNNYSGGTLNNQSGSTLNISGTLKLFRHVNKVRHALSARCDNNSVAEHSGGERI